MGSVVEAKTTSIELTSNTTLVAAEEPEPMGPLPGLGPSDPPRCHGMQEIPSAEADRVRLAQHLNHLMRMQTGLNQDASILTRAAAHSLIDSEHEGLDASEPDKALFHHLIHGLALTIGSALGSTPPSTSTCLEAFLVPNKALLTAGARAWSKHAHRSRPIPSDSPTDSPDADTESQKKESRRVREDSDGWWGTPSGPVATINERALALFWKVMHAATWRNLHWLPHRVLVYEVRVVEGYGMRWSQDQSPPTVSELGSHEVPERPWIFRGFVEPMMENGHEVGWRHQS